MLHTVVEPNELPESTLNRICLKETIRDDVGGREGASESPKWPTLRVSSAMSFGLWACKQARHSRSKQSAPQFEMSDCGSPP